MVKRSNLTVTKWAPLVYGRTHEVDFRFLAKPADFGKDRENWSRGYILASFSFSTYDELRGHPRWIMFQDAQRRVIGTSCMVEEIPDVPDEQCRDKEGRPLYIFIGLVSQTPFPQIPAREFPYLREIYDEYVKPRFRERGYSQDKGKPLISRYETKDLPPLSEPRELLSNKLNADEGKVGFWPEEDNEKVWYSAARSTEIVSVCLGLNRKYNALTGPLSNATVHGLSSPCVADKEIEPPKELPPPPDQPPFFPSPRKSRQHDYRNQRADFWNSVADFLKSLCPCNWSDSQRSLARERKEGGSGRGHHQRQPQIPAGFRSKPRDSRPGKKIAEPSPALPKPEDDGT